jgi:hypothetical protein
VEGLGSADRRDDTEGARRLGTAGFPAPVAHHPEADLDPIERAHRCLTSGDVEVVLDAAAATIGARRVWSEAHRLHHRPGRSITRVERAALTPTTTRNGRAGTPGSDALRDAILVAHAHHAPVPEPVERIEVAGARLAVWAYPNDPYLPGLRLATDHAWVAAHLRDAGLRVDGLTLIRRAYRPARGAVVEARMGSASTSRAIAFLKVLRPDRLHEVVRVHTMLAGSLPVPRVLTHTDDVAILTVMPGTPLRRTLRRKRPLPHPDDLVALSVRLAASGTDMGRDPRRRTEPTTHAARLRDRVPDLAAALDAIVAAAADDVGAPLVTVHGDLHGGQILTADGKVSALLDLDGVGRGNLVDDAANLIAHLAAQGDHRPAAADHAARYAAGVLAAYRTVIAPETLPPAVASAWLSLAVVAHRAGDDALLRERVDRGLRALDGGTGISLPRSATW